MQIKRAFGFLVLVAAAALAGCKDGGASQKSSSDDETSEHKAKRPTSKSAEVRGTASAVASAAAPAHATLDSLFDGAPPSGTKLSTLHLGIPSGWESGEFGEVKTASKDGYSAIYDLPVFPPETSHVTLRAQSLGCKEPTLSAPVDGHIGAAHLAAKLYKGTCTFGGAPATIWAAAMKADDGPKTIVIAVKNDSLGKLEADIPTIIRGYGK
jgi:hypothetical protein